VFKIPTNKKGYIKRYYRKERNDVVKQLGGKCDVCGTKRNLQIHHKKPIRTSSGRGSIWRLTEQKRHIKNCELLCRKHHLDIDNK